MKLFIACMLALTQLGFIHEAAEATSFDSKTFDELTNEAALVLLGTFVGATSRRIGAGAIVSDHRFRDIDVVKGTSSSSEFELTMLGGTVGDDTWEVSGAPAFTPEVRYIIFVAGNGSVMFPLVGGHQGIFQSRKDGESGPFRVYDYGGRPIIGSSPLTGGLFKRADGSSGSLLKAESEAISTDAFVSFIRSKLGR